MILLDIFTEEVMLTITKKFDKKGIKRKDLADYLNVSSSTINRWYNLERFPRPDVFRLLVTRLYDDVTEFELYDTADTNEKLLLLRLFAGLSLKELSESIIISRTLLSSWEKGSSYPTFTQIQRLALFYDVPQVDLGVPIKHTTLGTKIRQERLALGLTQAELADALGVSSSLMSLYERDMAEIPEGILSVIIDELELTKDYMVS